VFSNLGKAISLLRLLRGRSQASVAREAGIGNSQLSKYESGKELPRLDSLERVLAALGVGYLELFRALKRIDHTAANLGGESKDEIDSPWTTLLSPEPQAAFERVFTMLVRLQREMVEGRIAK
jgi:transcriptional regulator with XRE-family HTH domain